MKSARSASHPPGGKIVATRYPSPLVPSETAAATLEGHLSALGHVGDDEPARTAGGPCGLLVLYVDDRITGEEVQRHRVEIAHVSVVTTNASYVVWSVAAVCPSVQAAPEPSGLRGRARLRGSRDHAGEQARHAARGGVGAG